jgi:hypothetical protein
MNDIFYFIDKSILYNYADDNNIAFSKSKLDILKNTFENESKILIINDSTLMKYKLRVANFKPYSFWENYK